MLLKLFINASLFSSLASASTGTFSFSTTVTSCSYELNSGGVPPTPVPTSETDYYGSQLTTTTTTTVSPPTVTITAPTVTGTLYTAVVYTYAVPTVTVPISISYTDVLKTVATGTFAATVCANGAKPTTTVTKYTGTYKAISGQQTTVPATYPVFAVCATGTIYSTILLPTVTLGATITKTVTPTTYVTSYTTTTTSEIIYYTVTSYLTTVTSTSTTYTPHSMIATSTVACPGETLTKTLDTRCAPTNLIGAINGEGLLSGRYADRTSVVYTRQEPWASDYTACCQACIDSKGCAASESGGGACGLLYGATPQGEPVCDAFILSFTSSPNAYPGQSLIIQTGCGLIEYDGSLP